MYTCHAWNSDEIIIRINVLYNYKYIKKTDELTSFLELALFLCYNGSNSALILNPQQFNSLILRFVLE